MRRRYWSLLAESAGIGALFVVMVLGSVDLWETLLLFAAGVAWVVLG